jgi:hypothetical protein
MNYSKQKEFFRFSLIIAFITGASNAVFSQVKFETESSKFLILFEATEDGVKLTSQEGCAWKVLTFTLNQDKPQAVDQYGMTSLNKDKPTEDKNLANFLFIVKKIKEGVSLEGKSGTAWTKLNFSCPKGKCSQYLDFYGMARKD